MIDKLIQRVKNCFDQIADHRYKNKQTSVGDYIQSAFAMFSLKDPSLHHYRINYPVRSENLERVYKVGELHSDSAMRAAIDGVPPTEILKAFKIPIQELIEQGVMDKYRVLGKYHCINFDGTEHYCSCKTACDCCLTKVHKNKKGEITKTTYHHQAMSAVLVRYDGKEVFPIACEAILRQDGSTKNDCELNASKRLLPLVHQMLPANEGYELLGNFDGLYPNGPFIKELQELNMRFMIGIKEGYVLVQAQNLKKTGGPQVKEWVNEQGHQCIAKWANSLILNGQNQDVKVNYIEFEQYDKKSNRVFFSTWVTDVPVDESNVQELVLIARSRWKIENETFNTLKNQGYHLEHSYGHGEKHLATNFMLLTFLAFLVDQVAQRLPECLATQNRAVQQICRQL